MMIRILKGKNKECESNNSLGFLISFRKSEIPSQMFKSSLQPSQNDIVCKPSTKNDWYTDKFSPVHERCCFLLHFLSPSRFRVSSIARMVFVYQLFSRLRNPRQQCALWSIYPFLPLLYVSLSAIFINSFSNFWWYGSNEKKDLPTRVKPKFPFARQLFCRCDVTMLPTNKFPISLSLPFKTINHGMTERCEGFITSTLPQTVLFSPKLYHQNANGKGTWLSARIYKPHGHKPVNFGVSCVYAKRNKERKQFISA